MNRPFITICVSVGLVLAAASAAKTKDPVAPGARIQMLAHNAYPDHGKYTDRLDRAIAAGVPFAVEQDLAWVNSRSLIIHGKKNVGGDDPTLETYFFPKVQPLMEKAMKLPRERRQEAVAMLATRDPEQLVTQKADNYHRWFGVNWAFIEKGGEAHAGEWTTAKEERLKKFADYGHRLGYLVSFYCLDGYSDSENQGWSGEYNFGSREAVQIRGNALIRAHADFISTDQYETVAGLIRTGR